MSSARWPSKLFGFSAWPSAAGHGSWIVPILSRTGPLATRSFFYGVEASRVLSRSFGVAIRWFTITISSFSTLHGEPLRPSRRGSGQRQLQRVSRASCLNHWHGPRACAFAPCPEHREPGLSSHHHDVTSPRHARQSRPQPFPRSTSLRQSIMRPLRSLQAPDLSRRGRVSSSAHTLLSSARRLLSSSSSTATSRQWNGQP